MRWQAALMALVACIPVFVGGCSGARMVHVSSDGGVVAIPSNSNYWPYYHRDRALALIKERCPNGYEIVREEEVVTGQVSHTDARTDTQEAPAFVLGGGESNTSKGRNGTSRTSGSFGGLAVPLGETQQKTTEVTRYSNVTEWRITFRPK